MLNLLFAFFIFSSSSFAKDHIRAEALRFWQKRDNVTDLKESLSRFEKIHAQNPEDIETLTYLTRGYYILADNHLDDPNEKKATYEKAKNFGEAGLATNPEYKQFAKKDIKRAIDKLTEREVPIAFWTAAALGRWAKLNGVMASLKYKDQILSTVSQVEKIKPDFFYGSVPRYWGGYYAVAPGIVGGSMKKSKKYFEEALRVAPNHLGTKVLFAELYWVEEGNKKEFTRLLEEVIAAPITQDELAPENRMEKSKAQKLLDRTNDFFKK